MALARMGAALQLAPTSALPEHMAELQDLPVFRRGLVKDRTAAQTRLTQRLAQIERQVGWVDAAMKDIVEADQGLRERLGILVSISGISTALSGCFARTYKLPPAATHSESSAVQSARISNASRLA